MSFTLSCWNDYKTVLEYEKCWVEQKDIFEMLILSVAQNCRKICHRFLFILHVALNCGMHFHFFQSLKCCCWSNWREFEFTLTKKFLDHFCQKDERSFFAVCSNNMTAVEKVPRFSSLRAKFMIWNQV